MATYYLWSGATGSATGADWTNAYTAWSSVPSLSSGDVVKIHTGTTPHSESSTSDFTFAGPSTDGSALIIGVDKNSSDAYNPATNDTFTTSNTTADITFDGSLAIQGIRFKSGDTFIANNGDSNEIGYFEDCYFDCQTDRFNLSGGYTQYYYNCSFVLGTAGIIYSAAVGTTFIGCTFTGSSSYIIQEISSLLIFQGCDFTGCSGSNLYWHQSRSKIIFIGCDLPSFTEVTTMHTNARFYESATTANPFANELKGGLGGSVSVVEGVYRDGGATYDGTNEYSLKLSAKTNNGFYLPVETDWQTGYIAADSGTQTTWTVYIANSSADINDDDCWLEVEYFGDSGSTLKTIATTRPATVLVTPSPITDDAVNTWTGITEFAQKLSIQATVALAGMYRWRVCSTFTTTDVYVCPKADVAQA